MRIIHILTAIAVVAFLYLLVFQRDLLIPASTQAEPEAAEAPLPDADPFAVVAIRATSQLVPSPIQVRGQTEAARQVNLVAQTSGAVISDPIRKGSVIDAGQALCQLDPGTREISLADAQARLAEARARVPETEARVAEAEARLEAALIDERAATKLSAGGFASDTRVASSTASTKAARAAVAAAKAGLKSTLAGIQSAEAAVAGAAKEIERLSISASFAGILESDTAELGSVLQPGGLCGTVIQLDPIKIVAFLPEIAVGKISEGSIGKARLTTGTEIEGEVTFISRASDPLTRTFRLEITVPNPNLKIRDGQTAEITLFGENQTAHFLPGSALTLNDAGDLGVRTVDADNIVGFAPVSLILDTATGVWVSGLKDTENVIVIGQEFVSEGVQTNVVFKEASP